MTDWKETKQSLNRGFRLGIGWWVLIVLVVLAMGGLIWALTVALSAPKGAGDVIIQNNSADNRIAQQARFEDNYQEIVTSDQKIVLAKAQSDATPTDKTLQTNYTGLVGYCLSVTADYNADAGKILAKDWMSETLPKQIDPFDPNTDCAA